MIDSPDPKQRQLDEVREDAGHGHLTTAQGVRVDDTDNAMTAGERGPTLLEDFQAREKITHFDHERIPERVVHARGAGAYGYFEPYDDRLAEHTAAKFLTTPGRRTPVFVRFSTVAGSRGSADTVRDIRGFATKFYTEEGNYDLVGNNAPVFFIQDGIKFPDFVHAVKPEPHNEIPQAASAHDTLWDFVSLQPETLHAIMWAMSDRALPRSYRMMQGFGVHTFRLVNDVGAGVFVKFHWTPKLGVHSLLWDECQKVSGNDPDFHRRDLWDAIAAGDFPEWELGVQLVDEDREFDFPFDLLDATKIIPEELAPVLPVGRMTLDRNPDNFFAETEQVAFHTANLVPGIDFSNDPLLQFRNFSYLDTQLIRLGGPNFAHLPVNRPVAPANTNQRDGYSQHAIHRGEAAYHPNTVGGGCPAIADEGVYRHYTEKVEGQKIRRRSPSFADHYSQARLFWQSMSAAEADHIVAAFSFELGKVGADTGIRERTVGELGKVARPLAERVANRLGLPAPDQDEAFGEHSYPPSPALSQTAYVPDTIATRRIAILAADGVDAAGLTRVADALRERGAVPEVLSIRHGGVITGHGDEQVAVDRGIATMASVLYDAVLVPGGAESVDQLACDGQTAHFVTEAFKHLKTIGAFGDGRRLLQIAGVCGRLAEDGEDTGVVADDGLISCAAGDSEVPPEFVEQFAAALAQHRAWGRTADAVPA